MQGEKQGDMASGGQEIWMTMERSTGIHKRGLAQAVLEGMDCSTLCSCGQALIIDDMAFEGRGFQR